MDIKEKPLTLEDIERIIEYNREHPVSQVVKIGHIKDSNYDRLTREAERILQQGNRKQYEFYFSPILILAIVFIAILFAL